MTPIGVAGYYPPDDRRCTYVFPDEDPRRGKRCPSWRLTGTDYCFFHDPANKHRVEDARRKGQEAHSNRVSVDELVSITESLRTPEDIQCFLVGLIHKGQEKKISPPMLNALRQVVETVLESQKIASQVDPGLLLKSDEEILQEIVDHLKRTGQWKIVESFHEMLTAALLEKGKEDKNDTASV